MFLLIAVILIVLWLLGLLSGIGGSLIYFLVVLALISVIVHFWRSDSRTSL